MITENPNAAELNNKFLNERSLKKSFVLFFMVVLGISVDQVIKYLVFLHSSPPLGLMQFRNYQFAFSLPVPTVATYGLYALVLIVAGYFFSKRFFRIAWVELIAWALLFAGGLSNVGERIALGYVRDYFLIFNGIFNLADFFIIAGVLILLISNF